ncbi:hypothetical protein C4E44_26130 [Pseudomonas sp. MWU12-2312b]|nr:hypothetical protein C4E44_26130 [Pseudomonas sp. MWU12-2312b]
MLGEAWIHPRPATTDLSEKSQAPNNCRSEPARDDARTFNTSVDCHTSIASKLAPTGKLQ